MRSYDFSPLYRSFVGFDRMASLINSASQSLDANTSYPPYNVARIDENAYKIELAVAGFAEDELEIESHENVLTIHGNKEKADNDSDPEYLHRGIAARGFERKFQLADHVFVSGAELRNGLLVIALKRELPEALKPRKISIGANANSEDDGKLITKKPSRKAKAA